MIVPQVRAPYIDPAADSLLSTISGPRKALFLDRDGVINVNHGYVHAPEQTEWVHGIFNLLGIAHERGFLPIVVTNQAGIGRGFYDEPTFLAFTAWMHVQFARRRTPLLATYWCPHHAEAGLGNYRVDCDCRKPRPAMLLAAIERFDIDPARSLMIGDAQTDLAAAHAAHVEARLFVGNDIVNLFDEFNGRSGA